MGDSPKALPPRAFPACTRLEEMGWRPMARVPEFTDWMMLFSGAVVTMERILSYSAALGVKLVEAQSHLVYVSIFRIEGNCTVPWYQWNRLSTDHLC